MLGYNVLLKNLREFGSERIFVVEVDVLAGLGVRCVMMVEKKGKCRVLLYTKTKEERMLKKGGIQLTMAQ
jgi:hypothetical protein